jgi:hypothetical protein
MALAASNLHAQVLPPTPTTPPSPQVVPPPPSQQADTQRVTATGCLKQERDVPGLLPNVAERSSGEDYVLTNARLKTVAVSGKSSAAMYRITGLDKEKLQSLLNQQVEVTGRLETVPRSTSVTPPPTAQPDKHAETESDMQSGRVDELQRIRATTIKSIAGTCTGGTW